MTVVAAFLRIVFLIPIGLMVAIGVAVIVYLAAFGFSRDDIWGGPDHLLPVIVFPAFVIAADIARFALLPFLAGIVLSEVFAIRSMLAWTLFGGAIGVAIPLAAYGTAFAFLPPTAAGLCAGFAYWLIAGHGAGLVRSVSGSVPE